MPFTTSVQAFDRLERVHSAWTRGEAVVVISEAGPQGTTKARFRLDLDGAGGATLRVQIPEQGRSAATDQIYVLRGNKLTGVDTDAGERIHRLAPDRGSIGLRLTAVLGGLNDAIGFLTAPEVRNRYLLPLRALDGWQVTPTRLVRRTTAAGRASLTRLDLDATGRLRALHVELPGSKIDWRIAYGSARTTSLPRNLRLVEAFTARPRLPRFADSKAKSSVQRTLTALGRLQSGRVKLDGTATLAFDGRRIRYEAGSMGYAYDGRNLTMMTPGAAYQGNCSRAAVIDEVATALGAIDPLARSVLVRTTPFGELFPPEAKVSLVGSSKVEGQPCDMVKIEAPRFRAYLQSRKADGLPLTVEAVALDNRGRELTTTRRSISWSSVGQSLPKTLFSLPVRFGQTVLPLPKRQITAP